MEKMNEEFTSGTDEGAVLRFSTLNSGKLKGKLLFIFVHIKGHCCMLPS